jgi:hypothetical protein
MRTKIEDLSKSNARWKNFPSLPIDYIRHLSSYRVISISNTKKKLMPVQYFIENVSVNASPGTGLP